MNSKGFTLVELLVAVTILLIVTLGFFSWSYTIIIGNSALQKINTANSFVLDVADRLQRMSDTALIRAKGGNEKYVGFDASGQLKKCISNLPTGAITADTTGMTEYTNPLGGKKLYLYDNNVCSISTPSCFSSSIITDASNAYIDHPNFTTNPDSINPIRFSRNTTYYAVWSVAYLSCDATQTNKRKIFITVYWIDPEPNDVAVSDVLTKIASGVYALKSVSLVVDKVIGVES